MRKHNSSHHNPPHLLPPPPLPPTYQLHQQKASRRRGKEWSCHRKTLVWVSYCVWDVMVVCWKVILHLFLFFFFLSIFSLFFPSSLHLPSSFPLSIYSLPLSLPLSLLPSLLPPPHRVWTMTLATISPSKSVCEASQTGLVDYTHSPHTKQLCCVSLECNALLF